MEVRELARRVGEEATFPLGLWRWDSGPKGRWMRFEIGEASVGKTLTDDSSLGGNTGKFRFGSTVIKSVEHVCQSVICNCERSCEG